MIVFAAGDLEKAQEYQASIASFRACFKYGNPNTVVKTAVALLGYDVGKCRAPFNQLPEEGVAPRCGRCFVRMRKRGCTDP